MVSNWPEATHKKSLHERNRLTVSKTPIVNQRSENLVIAKKNRTLSTQHTSNKPFPLIALPGPRPEGTGTL
jgi:hypothetical protein